MSRTLRLFESGPMRDVGRYPDLPIPNCRPCPGQPHSACRTYLRCIAQSIFALPAHPTGTCRMGNSSEPRAVVSERLAVRGVDRLRVVDASVMPDTPNANTNAATIMIAERASDLIRQDHSLS